MQEQNSLHLDWISERGAVVTQSQYYPIYRLGQEGYGIPVINIDSWVRDQQLDTQTSSCWEYKAMFSFSSIPKIQF
jgi:hypothetical protein